MTTWDPGAREVFTQGFVINPRSQAFFASKPAPISTLGFDVFVHEVIAAIKIEPSLISSSVPSTFEVEKVSLFVMFFNF